MDTEFFRVAKGENETASFKKSMMSQPEKVVEQAVKDAALGNEMSIYGVAMRLAKGATKVLPQKVIMNIFK